MLDSTVFTLWKKKCRRERSPSGCASCDGGLEDQPGPVTPAWRLPGDMARAGMRERRRLQYRMEGQLGATGKRNMRAAVVNSSCREVRSRSLWVDQLWNNPTFELNLLCRLVTGSADPTWITIVWKHRRAVALPGTARAGNAEQPRCCCLSCAAFSQYVFSLHIALIMYFSSCSSLRWI